MNYLMQTDAKCGIGTEADAKKFLHDLAVAAKPVSFAIYVIAGVDDVRACTLCSCATQAVMSRIVSVTYYSAFDWRTR